uniref:Ankyrin repeat protein RF_0381 n=1 Tax=Culex pipiens TaxID=7175 RepID=A0A8D8JCP8_CULPI
MEQPTTDVVPETFEYNATCSDGMKYQRYVAVYLLLKATLKNCPFELAFEMKVGKYFDDVVFHSNDEWWLIQVKHTKRSRKLTDHMLFQAKRTNFRLATYLGSYCNIRDNPQNMFTGKTNCVILTTSMMSESLKQRCKTLQLNEYFNLSVNSTHYNLSRENWKEIDTLVEDANKTFFEVQGAVIQLFTEGKVSKTLIEYRTPLKSVIEKESNDKLRLKKPSKEESCAHSNKLYNLLHQKIKPPTVKLDRKKVTKFFSGVSRKKYLPPFVDKPLAEKFFGDFYLSVQQPQIEEFLHIIHMEIHKWMRTWVHPDDFSRLTPNQLQIPAKQLTKFLRKWEDSKNNDSTARGPNTRERKFLKLEDMKEWMSSVQHEIDVWIKQRPKKSCMSLKDMEGYYIKRRISYNFDQTNSAGRKFQLMKDTDFIKHLFTKFSNQKWFILIAGPGMGKSVLMQRLAFEAQKKFLEKNVYLIYLSDICESIGEISEIDDVLRIFESFLSPTNLKNIKCGNSDIILFLDGFDELRSKNVDSMMNAVELLMKKENIKLIVSSRQRMQKKLESKLNVPAMSVEPLSFNDQLGFLKAFWKCKAGENFKNVSEHFSTTFYNTLLGKHCDIFGTPLMLRILAEIYLEFSNCYPSIITIYDRLIAKTLNETYNKINNVQIDKQIPTRCRSLVNQWEDEYKKIALNEKLPEKLKKLLFGDKFEALNFETNSIRNRMIANKEESFLMNVFEDTRFAHPSYGLFLIAHVLYVYINSYCLDGASELKKEISVFLQQHEVERLFFFEMVNSKTSERHLKFLKIFEEKSAFWSCQGNCCELVKRLRDVYDYKTISDGDSKQAMVHVAAKFNAYQTLQFLLDIPCDPNCRNAQGRTPLHEAAENNHLEVLKLLMSKNGDILAPDSRGNTIIHSAVISGSKKIVEFVLSTGVDISSVNVDGDSPIHLAIRKNDIQIVKIISSKINLMDKTIDTLLHFAVNYGSKEVVKYLIEKGIAKNCRTAGNNPLQLAIQKKDIEKVKILAEAGAWVHVKDKKSDTALHYAVKFGTLEIVKYLVGFTDLNYVNLDGHTALHLAIKQKKTEIVKFLFSRYSLDQIDPIIDKNKNTILHYAVKHSSKDVIEYIVKQKDYLKTRNKLGQTPLHKAKKRNDIGVIEVLLNNGAQINTVDSNFDTILHFAAKHGSLDVAKYLIDKEADVNSVNFYGETPAHVAVKNKRLDMLELLTSRGARVDLKEEHGNNALHLAVESRSVEIVQYLIDKGIDVNAQNIAGLTAAEIAKRLKYSQIYKLLASKGAVLDANEVFDSDPETFNFDNCSSVDSSDIDYSKLSLA